MLANYISPLAHEMHFWQQVGTRSFITREKVLRGCGGHGSGSSVGLASERQHNR